MNGQNAIAALIHDQLGATLVQVFKEGGVSKTLFTINVNENDSLLGQLTGPGEGPPRMSLQFGLDIAGSSVSTLLDALPTPPGGPFAFLKEADLTTLVKRVHNVLDGRLALLDGQRQAIASLIAAQGPAGLRDAAEGLFAGVLSAFGESGEGAKPASVSRLRQLLGRDVGVALPFATILNALQRAGQNAAAIPKSIEDGLLDYFFKADGFRTVDRENIVAPVHVSDVKEAVADAVEHKDLAGLQFRGLFSKTTAERYLRDIIRVIVESAYDAGRGLKDPGGRFSAVVSGLRERGTAAKPADAIETALRHVVQGLRIDGRIGGHASRRGGHARGVRVPDQSPDCRRRRLVRRDRGAQAVARFVSGRVEHRADQGGCEAGREQRRIGYRRSIVGARRCLMAKKLVVCCDGTWNTPRTETNIFRTYRFLRERLGGPTEVTHKDGVRTCGGRATDGSEVVLFYDAGVGTDWFSRLLGGGVGAGLSDNVRDAYRFLGHNYAPGSEIYLFGFSRGAYTARSLCGFIKAAGLLDKPSANDVWRVYMDRYVTTAHGAPGVVARPSGWGVDKIRGWLVEKAGDAVGRLGGDVATLPTHGDVKIKFIGVYDTVGALGVPIPAAARVNEPIVGFHNTMLGDTVENAVQALAVDEKRGPYTPAVWTQAANATALAGQSVLQVWFPGVHSDIGGGYHDKGIGDITWDFMMRQAADKGLVIDDHVRTPDLELKPLPAQHESFDKAWQDLSAKLKLIPQGVRAIGPKVIGPGGEELAVAPKVMLHPCLVSRLGKRCTTILDEKAARVQEGDYVPVNVKADTLPVFA